MLALLERADRNAKNAVDVDGNTPLLLAARYGHVGVVRALVAAKVDLLVVNKAGHKASDAARTAIDAVSGKNTLKAHKKAVEDMVELLVEAEIDQM